MENSSDNNKNANVHQQRVITFIITWSKKKKTEK